MKEYLIALGVFVLVIVVLRLFKYVIVSRLKRLAAKTRTEIDEVLTNIVDKLGWPLYIFVSLYIAIKFVEIPAFVVKAFQYVTIAVFTYYVVRGIQSLIDYGTKRVISRRQEEEKEADTSLIGLLSRLLKGALWGIAVVVILANLGYNVSGLIAGLGIGGIAIAFALQNVLSDVFASFSIYFDKPFKVGDFIIVGNDLGVVKRIGIQSTRLQSLWGQEVVISNRELTSARINNYKKMERRRIHFTFGVVYQTSSEKLRRVLQIVKEVFSEIQMADLDRVHFKEFGDFSLDFEIAYYVNTGDYNKYMDIQQVVNFAIKGRFEKEGIEFAYPTQTILVSKGE